MNRAERRAAARKMVKRDVSGANIREARRYVAKGLKDAGSLDDAAPKIRDLGDGVGMTESGLIVPHYQ